MAINLGRRAALAGAAALAASAAVAQDDSTPISAKSFYDGQMAFWNPIIKKSGAKPE